MPSLFELPFFSNYPFIAAQQGLQHGNLTHSVKSSLVIFLNSGLFIMQHI